jgi:hypothetical protein
MVDTNGQMAASVSMMGSMVSMLSTTVRVFNAINTGYNFATSVLSCVQIYQELTSGLLFTVIVLQIQNIIQIQPEQQFAPETAKLTKSDFWADAGMALLASIPKIMFAMYHRMDGLVKLFSDKHSKWVLYMPTPYETWIPNPTLSVHFPGFKIANKPVELRLGGGGTHGDYRGRLWGLGTVTRKTAEKFDQLFRMDYHPSTHQPSDEYFEAHGNTYNFHFHLGQH